MFFSSCKNVAEVLTSFILAVASTSATVVASTGAVEDLSLADVDGLRVGDGLSRLGDFGLPIAGEGEGQAKGHGGDDFTSVHVGWCWLVLGGTVKVS